MFSIVRSFLTAVTTITTATTQKDTVFLNLRSRFQEKST